MSLRKRKQSVFETQGRKLGSKECKWAGWKEQSSKTAKDKMYRTSFVTLITYFYLDFSLHLFRKHKVTEKNTKEASGKQWAQRVTIMNLRALDKSWDLKCQIKNKQINKQSCSRMLNTNTNPNETTDFRWKGYVNAGPPIVTDVPLCGKMLIMGRLSMCGGREYMGTLVFDQSSCELKTALK